MSAPTATQASNATNATSTSLTSLDQAKKLIQASLTDDVYDADILTSDAVIVDEVEVIVDNIDKSDVPTLVTIDNANINVNGNYYEGLPDYERKSLDEINAKILEYTLSDKYIDTLKLNSFYGHAYQGGCWKDCKYNSLINIDAYNNSTPNGLLLSNTTNKAFKYLKKNKLITFADTGKIALYEHYFPEQTYFHLIYDVDDVHNEDEYLEAMAYFNKLSKYLGDYSIAEYTTDKALADKYKIHYIQTYEDEDEDEDEDDNEEEAKNDNESSNNSSDNTSNDVNDNKAKKLNDTLYGCVKEEELANVKDADKIIKKYYSAHIVFYEKRIHIKLLKELFALYKPGKGKETTFVNEGIKYQDKSIWNELIRPNGKGRIMRTAISDKLGGISQSSLDMQAYEKELRQMVKDGKLDKNKVKDMMKLHNDVISKGIKDGTYVNKFHLQTFKPTHVTKVISGTHDRKKLPLSTNLITIPLKDIPSLPSITKDDLIACGIVFKDANELLKMNRERLLNRSFKQRITYQRENANSGILSKDKLNSFTLYSEYNDKNIVPVMMSIDELKNEVLPLIYEISNEDNSKHIHPFELGKKISCILYMDAYHVFDKYDLDDILLDWYNDKDDIHDSPSSVTNFNMYYEANKDIAEVAPNLWFYSLLKYVNSNERTKIPSLIHKYCPFITDLYSFNNYDPSNEMVIEYITTTHYSIRSRKLTDDEIKELNDNETEDDNDNEDEEEDKKDKKDKKTKLKVYEYDVSISCRTHP